MPATFSSFGLKFLYPDNWKPVEREESEGGEGVTLELPSGGFFAVERLHDWRSDEAVLEQVATSIQEEYSDVERELLQLEGAGEEETSIEVRFYFLDLLVVSQVVLLTAGGHRYLVQMQAESRDFDQNAQVFTALLKQIRES